VSGREGRTATVGLDDAAYLVMPRVPLAVTTAVEPGDRRVAIVHQHDLDELRTSAYSRSLELLELLQPRQQLRQYDVVPARQIRTDHRQRSGPNQRAGPHEVALPVTDEGPKHVDIAVEYAGMLGGVPASNRRLPDARRTVEMDQPRHAVDSRPDSIIRWRDQPVPASLDVMNVEVRTITAEDWSLFRDLRLRALADSPDAFGRTLAEAEELTDDFWRQRTEGPGPTLIVLEGGRGVAMGGAFTPPDSSIAYIWGMWTAPEARGRGYAAKVLADLVSWCRERDLGVRLHVTEGNDAARRLYLAHGFKSTGVWEPLREGSSLRIEELQLVD